MTIKVFLVTGVKIESKDEEECVVTGVENRVD